MSDSQKTFVSPTTDPRNSEFIDSLDSLSVNDVVPPHRKKSSKSAFSFSKIYRIVIVLLCAAVFIYCIFELTDIVNDYKAGEDLYGDIENAYWAAVNGFTDGNVLSMGLSNSDMPMVNYSTILAGGSVLYEPPNNPIGVLNGNRKFLSTLVHLESLRDQNPDTYGQIIIPDTEIHYPLVQCGDNDYYLNHAPDGTEMAVGSIFIDFRNHRKVEENKNIIIYGHNMLNGSMFADVQEFANKNFFMDTAHDIEIATFDAIYTFRVFSVYKTDMYDRYFQTYFKSDEEFLSFCKFREERSDFHREGIEFSSDDVIITLSTCTLGQKEGRFVVHAKLIKVEK